jgi:HK97 family phage prohead protease
MPEKTARVLDAYAKAETRQSQDGKMFIDGMIPYNSRSEEIWGFVEVIAPGAFKRTLNNGTDIYAFWAHDEAQVLASRKGGTLALEDTPAGLRFSVEVRETERGRDYFEAVQRGDVSGVSFGFFSEVEEWDSKAEPAVRTLKEVRLLEISPGVAFPAYPGAQSDASRRSLYAEGAPEFRSRFKQAPAPEPAPEPTPDPSAAPTLEARMTEQEAARAHAELDLLLAGIF